MSDILIEHAHTQFTHDMYNIYESSIKLLNQHTWPCVKKFGKACNDNFPAPSLLFSF